MIYNKVLEKFGSHKEVVAAYIGTGHFGTAVISQQGYVEGVKLPVVGDISRENAKNAFLKAGIPEEKIAYFSDAREAEDLLQKKLYIYTDKCETIMDIPSVNIICEGTGNPEAGARYCMSAIEKGKNLVLVSKELDSAIGPLLDRKAKERGVIFSPVDGDQHGLLMQMVDWARRIGLTVISAGKSRDGEFILDEKHKTVTIAADGITVHETQTAQIPDDKMKYFQMIPKGADPMEYINERGQVLQSLPGAGAFDLCEMVISANATGMKIPAAPLSQGILRITELPVAYCTKEHGGIYEEEGNIDVYTCLRRYDEAGMGGGVYLVVKCDNAYSNYILTTKGQIPNHDLSTAVIYRPYHLCGVEVSTTLLCVQQLGISTGSTDYKPRYDLVKKVVEDVPCGEVLGNDHDLRMEAMLMPAAAKSPKAPVPAHILNGCRTVKDIKKGETITYSMIEDKSKSSLLWKLRREMEEEFNL